MSPRPRPDARLRLLCFAYAGGGSAVFTDWAAKLPEDIEVNAVRLPGRESRILQRPYDDLRELIPDLAEAIGDRYDSGPFVLFGHSMGALIAFAYARLLRDTGRRGPEHLLVSGRRAPQLSHNRPVIHDLPDDAFVERLRALGGTPEDLLNNPRVMRLIMPGLRSDFRLNDAYAYEPAPALDCPVTAFGGREDRHVDEAGLAAWAEQTTGPFALRMLPGGHFFLHSAQERLLRELAGILA
ncbi:thioesterase II family protein [Streptomyces profundus]|uniref:thioesterase II family protein n=1 Tax=Streptomyces profundus TaxID=2867410 RepID=UPI001D166ECD|nr:alpha/beta fold hydrolase [Streptomyces sp. MA3_2.13]UED83213.1 alpha/beta fold hydrolase [Streptomyces sp. MA3_2.13]